MNRREFCFSFGAVALGSTVAGWGHHLAATGTEKTEAHKKFRAKMIFFEHWRDRFDFPAAMPIRNELAVLADECDALIVNHRQCVPPKYMDVLETETSRLGLELYVPAEGNGIDFSRSHIRPLTLEENDSQVGLLFSLRDLRGIILCDTSRCRWRTFLRRTGETPPGTCARNTNLHTAQWLDAVCTESQKEFDPSFPRRR